MPLFSTFRSSETKRNQGAMLLTMWILPAHVPNRFKSARGFLQEVPEDGTNLRNGSKKSFFPTKHPLAAFAVLFLLVAQTSSGLGTRLIGTTFICAEMSEMFARAKYKLL